jgi:hypothetical protein
MALILLQEDGAYTESFDISPELMRIFYANHAVAINSKIT